MSEYLLTNELIYKSFIFGAQNVIKEKNNLNAINVFPVPDGDTGSNLASMMTSIIERSKLGATSEETIKSIVDAAIVGARGNSGIIFAEYIYGFSLDLKSNAIDEETFLLLAENASNYAYQSIAQPVEGTIITVMRAWSIALKKFKSVASSFIELMSKAYEFVLVELARTPELLAVLKENKVVDAGAKGFVHFIEGFLRALKGDEIKIEIEQVQYIEQSHVDHLDESQNRYCTEALIRGTDFDLKQLKLDLSKFGDSLVVAGSERTIRVHIHSDHPADVFAYLDNIGNIVEQKVDDMKRQFETANHRKYPIALVTDSIADLPESLIDQYQIHMFPLDLLINETNYYDKLTIENLRFYELMDSAKVYPSSSQPNPKTLENLFSFLTTYYEKIIVITVSKAMSGTNQAFVDAAAKFKKTKITVIDSKQNSGAEGLIVLKAAQMIDSNEKYEDIIKKIEKLTGQSKILVSVKTLKYMVRAGRVSKVTGLLGKIMNLKPVISIDEDGNGIIFDKGLSLKSSDKKIQKHIEEIQNNEGIESYAIVHANAEKRAAEYAKKYEKILGKKPTYIMNISTIVAMNAGIGTVAIAYIKGEKK